MRNEETNEEMSDVSEVGQGQWPCMKPWWWSNHIKVGIDNPNLSLSLSLYIYIYIDR